jgi:hypothetical protein
LPVGAATADVPIAVGVPLGKNATNAVGEAVAPPWAGVAETASFAGVTVTCGAREAVAEGRGVGAAGEVGVGIDVAGAGVTAWLAWGLELGLAATAWAAVGEIVGEAACAGGWLPPVGVAVDGKAEAGTGVTTAVSGLGLG